MIDLVLYRIRIGLFSGKCGGAKKKRNAGLRLKYGAGYVRDFIIPDRSSCIFDSIMYCILGILAVIILVFTYSNRNIFCNSDRDWVIPIPSSGTPWGLPLLSLIYIKIAYIILVFKPILGHCYNGYNANIFDFNTCILFNRVRTTRVKAILVKLFLAVISINFLLIAIVNPSLLNPGP